MKKIVKTMIALIATIAGLFGGWRLYSNRRQKGENDSES